MIQSSYVPSRSTASTERDRPPSLSKPPSDVSASPPRADLTNEPPSSAPEPETPSRPAGPIKRGIIRFLKLMFSPKGKKEWLYCVLIWAALIAGGAVLVWKVWPIILHKVLDPSLKHVRRTVPRIGIAVICIAWFSLAPLIFFTNTPAVILAAVVFGLWKGWLILLIGYSIGMTLPFLLGRRFLPRLVDRLRRKFKKVEALFEIVDRSGVVRVVIILRLSPLGGPAVSYLCSSHDLIAANYWKYIAASMVAVAPLLLLDCLTAGQIYTITSILQGKKVPTAQLVKVLISIASSIIIIIGGYIYWRVTLRKLEEEKRTRDALRAAEEGIAGGVQPAAAAGGAAAHAAPRGAAGESDGGAEEDDWMAIGHTDRRGPGAVIPPAAGAAPPPPPLAHKPAKPEPPHMHIIGNGAYTHANGNGHAGNGAMNGQVVAYESQARPQPQPGPYSQANGQPLIPSRRPPSPPPFTTPSPPPNPLYTNGNGANNSGPPQPPFSPPHPPWAPYGARLHVPSMELSGTQSDSAAHASAYETHRVRLSDAPASAAHMEHTQEAFTVHTNPAAAAAANPSFGSRARHLPHSGD